MLRLFDLSGLLLFLMGLGFLLGAAATGSSMAGILLEVLIDERVLFLTRFCCPCSGEGETSVTATSHSSSLLA